MILIYLWYCLWIVWFFIFSVYGLCFGPMVFYLLCPLFFYLFCLLDSVYYVFKANLLCVASQCHQWFETGRKWFDPGTMAWRIASLTLFTCSSRSLTFILRSLFLSLSMDSSVVRVGINLLMHLLSGLPAFAYSFHDTFLRPRCSGLSCGGISDGQNSQARMSLMILNWCWNWRRLDDIWLWKLMEIWK